MMENIKLQIADRKEYFLGLISYVNKHSKNYAEYIEEMKARYGEDIFLTGDSDGLELTSYNISTLSTMLKQLIEKNCTSWEEYSLLAYEEAIDIAKDFFEEDILKKLKEDLKELIEFKEHSMFKYKGVICAIADDGIYTNYSLDEELNPMFDCMHPYVSLDDIEVSENIDYLEEIMNCINEKEIKLFTN